MDFPESTKVVLNRIQKLEPEIATKILGYLLIQENSERDMIRLAFSPDNLLQSLINKAKIDLGIPPPPASVPISPSHVNQTTPPDQPLPFMPFLPVPSHPFLSPASLHHSNRYWEPQPSDGLTYSNSVPSDYRFQNHVQFLSMEDQSDISNSYFYSEPSLGPRSSRRSPSLPEFPFKVCHYFIKGFCKHGSNCRYYHGHIMPESFQASLNDDDQTFLPGSLEQLEIEITELLKSRRGYPVSIASLPMLYFEKYGRNLQAEGYLTESQRHGKAGYSLTKLLARLRNSIRLIDRPHGQHSVILAEDIPKYLEFTGERNDYGGGVSGSRQIYLTFPAESTFTEQDVSIYFNKFGLVQDVRIPCQQKRMFGFVTFVYAETVKQILAKGNPHFVCGARVLVKPYREKSRLVDRKYVERVQPSMYFGSQMAEMESEYHHMDGATARLFNQLVEEHRALQALGLENRLSEMQLLPRATDPIPEVYVGHAEQQQADPSSAEQLNFLMDVLNNGSTSEEKIKLINTKCNDQDGSQGLNLPDSPFASPIGDGISTVT